MCTPLFLSCNKKHPPLSFAAHKWPGYEFIFLAQRDKKLNPQLVHLLETDSASDSLHALALGKVDAAALTLDETLRARNKGIPLKAVLVFDISAGADVVLIRSDHEQQTLTGLRIGVEEGALGELMLSQFLQHHKLSKHEVHLIPLTPDQQEQAWDSKQIDALICYSPVSNRLLSKDAVKIFDSHSIPNMIVDVLAVRESALSNHTLAIKHLIAAHFEKLNYLQRNPQDAAFRIAAHLSIPTQEVFNAFRGMQLPNLTHNHKLLGGDPPALLSSTKALMNVMLEAGFLHTQDTALHTLFSDEFLPTLTE